WTSAIKRTAGGVPMRASPTNCAERWFQSVMASAQAGEARVVKRAAVSGTTRVAIQWWDFMSFPYRGWRSVRGLPAAGSALVGVGQAGDGKAEEVSSE